MSKPWTKTWPLEKTMVYVNLWEFSLGRGNCRKAPSFIFAVIRSCIQCCAWWAVGAVKEIKEMRDLTTWKQMKWRKLSKPNANQKAFTWLKPSNQGPSRCLADFVRITISHGIKEASLVHWVGVQCVWFLVCSGVSRLHARGAWQATHVCVTQTVQP